jgi:hypothetical protein
MTADCIAMIIIVYNDNDVIVECAMIICSFAFALLWMYGCLGRTPCASHNINHAMMNIQFAKTKSRMCSMKLLDYSNFVLATGRNFIWFS